MLSSRKKNQVKKICHSLPENSLPREEEPVEDFLPKLEQILTSNDGGYISGIRVVAGKACWQGKGIVSAEIARCAAPHADEPHLSAQGASLRIRHTSTMLITMEWAEFVKLVRRGQWFNVEGLAFMPTENGDKLLVLQITDYTLDVPFAVSLLLVDLFPGVLGDACERAGLSEDEFMREVTAYYPAMRRALLPRRTHLHRQDNVAELGEPGMVVPCVLDLLEQFFAKLLQGELPQEEAFSMPVDKVDGEKTLGRVLGDVLELFMASLAKTQSLRYRLLPQIQPELRRAITSAARTEEAENLMMIPDELLPEELTKSCPWPRLVLRRLVVCQAYDLSAFEPERLTRDNFQGAIQNYVRWLTPGTIIKQARMAAGCTTLAALRSKLQATPDAEYEKDREVVRRQMRNIGMPDSAIDDTLRLMDEKHRSEVEQKVEVSLPLLSGIETGSRTISEDMEKALTAALNLPPHILYLYDRRMPELRFQPYRADRLVFALRKLLCRVYDGVLTYDELAEQLLTVCETLPKRQE